MPGSVISHVPHVLCHRLPFVAVAAACVAEGWLSVDEVALISVVRLFAAQS